MVGGEEDTEGRWAVQERQVPMPSPVGRKAGRRARRPENSGPLRAVASVRFFEANRRIAVQPPRGTINFFAAALLMSLSATAALAQTPPNPDLLT